MKKKLVIGLAGAIGLTVTLAGCSSGGATGNETVTTTSGQIAQSETVTTTSEQVAQSETTAVPVDIPSDIEVNEINFPDEIFREFVLYYVETNENGMLDANEIADCKYMDVCRMGYYTDISSLKGIEYFTALETLNCNGNKLSSLDVSKNTALRILQCGGNNLSSLDVSKNMALETLECYSNNLSNLDVSKNTALTKLSCNSNNLSDLDVSNNSGLSELNCSENNLSRLDFNENLRHLWCSKNNLSSLDVSKNMALYTLVCDENNLSSLDVSKNTELNDVTFEPGGQTKEITATNGEILLSDLSPDIIASNIKDLNGAFVRDDKLTNITGDTITYNYETGCEYHTMSVTLNVTK